jgi:hypothetical protein
LSGDAEQHSGKTIHLNPIVFFFTDWRNAGYIRLRGHRLAFEGEDAQGGDVGQSCAAGGNELQRVLACLRSLDVVCLVGVIVFREIDSADAVAVE